MSTHVESVEVISSLNFRVSIAALEALEDEVDHPETHPFEDFGRWGKVQDGYVYPHRIPWGGEGSGSCYENLVEKILPIFEGQADLVVTWERGMGLDGLRVSKGKVVIHEVVQALGVERR